MGPEPEMGNATMALTGYEDMAWRDKEGLACRHAGAASQSLFHVSRRISDCCECCRRWVCRRCRHECQRCHGNACRTCWDGHERRCHRCTEAQRLQWMTSLELLAIPRDRVKSALRRLHVTSIGELPEVPDGSGSLAALLELLHRCSLHEKSARLLDDLRPEARPEVDVVLPAEGNTEVDVALTPEGRTEVDVTLSPEVDDTLPPERTDVDVTLTPEVDDTLPPEVDDTLPPEGRTKVDVALPPEGRTEVDVTLPLEGNTEVDVTLPPEGRAEVNVVMPPEKRTEVEIDIPSDDSLLTEILEAPIPSF